MSAVPEPDGFHFRMFRANIQKARDLYVSLIPHTRPSHCLRSRISNAEAHADMYIYA